MADFFVADITFGMVLSFLIGAFGVGLGWSPLAGCLAIFASLALIFQSFKVFLSPKVAVFCFCGLACGAFYYNYRIERSAKTANLPFAKQVSFSAIVSDEPKTSAKFLILPAEAERPFVSSVAIFAQPGSLFHYGDEVRITGAIEPPKFAGDSPAIFPKSIELIAEHKGFWLREKLIDFKTAIFGKFNEVLPADMAALLGGEVLGGTDAMSPELKKEMSASGTSYIAAMYGYKIAMIIFAMEIFLGDWLARRARFFLALAAVVLFVMMAGGTVSAVRGGAMAMAALAAFLAGRIFHSRNALAFAAFGMVLWDPMVLVQASFQLSFLSIIGIAYLAPPLGNFLEKILRWPPDADFLGLREATVLAVASLLPIIPVIANAFGDFSLTAFPSNILIWPGVFPAMVLGAALAVAGFLSSAAGFIVARLAEIVLQYQLIVIKIFSAFVVPLPFRFDSPIIMAFYYGALMLFIYRYADEKT